MNHFGFQFNPKATEKFAAKNIRPLFRVCSNHLVGTGRNKMQLLYQCVNEITGGLDIANQTIGDCVSHAGATAIDHTYCAQIKSEKKYRWVSRTASEPLYALSRVEIGKRQLGNRDGSCGAWLAEAVTKKGSLIRQVHGKYDLTTYSGERAKAWGFAGLPDDLEPTAEQYKILTASLVTNYYEAIDALQNGYAIVVCSDLGFDNVRDKDGFARPKGVWYHAQAIIAYDDTFKRPGCLIQNSWGRNWITGPKRLSQPDGSYWVDAEVIDRMLGKEPDSYAFSGYEGFKSQELDYSLI